MRRRSRFDFKGEIGRLRNHEKEEDGKEGFVPGGG